MFFFLLFFDSRRDHECLLLLDCYDVPFHSPCVFNLLCLRWAIFFCFRFRNFHFFIKNSVVFCIFFCSFRRCSVTRYTCVALMNVMIVAVNVMLMFCFGFVK